MTPFSPKPGRTVLAAANASAQYVQITFANKDALAPHQIRMMNNGTATVWVRFAKETGIAASATADFPVGPGVTEVLTVKISDGPIWASVIAAGSTGNIYFTPGIGN